MAQSKTSMPFSSCIKIKGIHFLPPLITEKKRIELQQYKQQAIKLEKRLKNCRELKKNLQELLNFQPLIDYPQSEITFKDDGHVEALGITERTKNISTSKNKHIQNISLTKDIIDVTEYNNDGIKMIQNGTNEKCLELNQSQISNVEVDLIKSDVYNNLSQSKKCEDNCFKINQRSSKFSTVPYNNLDNNIKKNKVALSETNNVIAKDISPERSPRPRLIRSNSYTLDSPSPILLAHLEKTAKNGDLNQYQQLSQSRNWSSLENNYIPFENSNFSSINTVYNNEDNISDKKDVAYNSTPISKTEKLNSEKSVSPIIEVIQTDISVQQITVNADTINDSSKNVCDISDPNSKLMQILQNIPDIYSKQIIELIKNQEFDKAKTTPSPKKIVKNCVSLDSSSRENPSSTQLTEKCAFQKPTNGDGNNKDFHHEEIETENSSRISLKSNLSNNTVHTQAECEHGSMHQSITFSDTMTSVSPSQSIHYSMTSSDTFRTVSSPSVKLIDLESDSDKILNDKCELRKSDGYGDILELYVQQQIDKNINVSRELFPQIDDIPTSIQTIKQEWAASVIGAHVKGYLTRRLLKTERVQTLIDTIKDALICALQLHNAENIDESDVELHRRLINQVSAACYTFHDIFFNLSIKEQMSVISTDRQRKIEKATRPVSAPGPRRSTSTSSRSSSKQRFPTQSQSLTKV